MMPPAAFRMPGPLRPTATQLPVVTLPPLMVNSPNAVALLPTQSSPVVALRVLMLPEVILTNPRAPAAVPMLNCGAFVLSALIVPPLISSTPF